MSEQVQVRHATVMDDESRQVGRVYAEALYAVAEEQHLAEEVLNELNQLVHDVFDADPGLELFFASASIDRSRKDDVIEQAFRGRASDVFTQFLHTLNQHGRLGMIRPLAEAYARLHNQKLHRVVVHAISAVPLTDDERDRLRDDVRAVGFEPVLQEKIEPDLLGGLIVRVGDWVYDASVRAKLESLRNQVIEGKTHGTAVG